METSGDAQRNARARLDSRVDAAPHRRHHQSVTSGSKTRSLLTGAASSGRRRSKRPTAIRFQKAAALGLLIAGGLLLPGCGRQEATESQTPAPRRAQPRHSRLQAALDSLRDVKFEHDPARRPLVLSEPAANRRDWALRALEHGYAQGGGTNSRWDSQMHAVFQAYVDYSRGSATEATYAALTNAVLTAVAAGCHDPMLRYMQVRYWLTDDEGSWEQCALASLDTFRAMFDSHYHPAFKFIVGYRALVAARKADRGCDRSGALCLVAAAMQDLARDTNAPLEEVYEPAFSWLDLTSAKGWTPYALKDLLPIMEANWKRGDAWFRWQGMAELKLAWDDRGTGWAKTVSETGWEGFRRHLDAAQSDLETAWRMNPTNAQTAYLMMRLELGQGQGHARMEQWFDRAMALATNYYDAANLMSYYLEPRWYGSEDEALEFARSCVTSTNWGGEVPLVLPDLHHSLAAYHKLADSPAYWHRREVWDDVKSAYDRFFELNPGEVGYRHNYARDAYLCGHYSEFLAQCRLFPSTNFVYFGGEDQFREMLRTAARKTRKDD